MKASLRNFFPSSPTCHRLMPTPALSSATERPQGDDDDDDDDDDGDDDDDDDDHDGDDDDDDHNGAPDLWWGRSS
jgi:hypothetical protein